jgi:hypothetical protein
MQCGIDLYRQFDISEEKSTTMDHFRTCVFRPSFFISRSVLSIVVLYELYEFVEEVCSLREVAMRDGLFTWTRLPVGS